jgi:hypothetical protein
VTSELVCFQTGHFTFLKSFTKDVNSMPHEKLSNLKKRMLGGVGVGEKENKAEVW